MAQRQRPKSGRSQSLRKFDRLNAIAAGRTFDFDVLVAALIGSFVAALADYIAKEGGHGGTSVVLVIQRKVFFSDVPPLPYLSVLLLMGIGAALCFVFRPETRVRGFALGLSVASVLMTAVPTKTSASPPIKRAHTDHIYVVSSCGQSGLSV
jgi:hypothetical protein